jgi:uncharacterized protein YegJ (DUF2314 family)
MFTMTTFEIWLITGVGAALAILVARFLARRLLVPRSLDLRPDDPAMLAATAQARANLGVFDSLREEPDRQGFVKFTLEVENETQRLWGQVESQGEDGYVVVTSDTPAEGQETGSVPVPLAKVEDWQVLRADGSIEGGFTQRVIFEKAREAWGRLPKAYEREEARYRPLESTVFEER